MPVPSTSRAVNGTVDQLLERLSGTPPQNQRRSGDTGPDLLRLFIEHSPDALQIISTDGAILYSNASTRSPVATLDGNRIEDFVHPDEIEAVRAALERCVSTAEPVEYEVALPPRTSEPRWGSARLVPICSDGEVQCVLAYGRDITDQRANAERLRASQQRLAMVFQATPLAAIIVDSNLTVSEWNPAAERLFGWFRAEALGQPLIDLIIPRQHRGSVRERFIDAFAGRYGFSRSRNVNITRHGDLVTCNWFNTPLYDQQGKIEAMAALGQDISRQIRAEEALTEAMRAAEASARAKSQFLANMSHEIRTPMHGVLGASELLLREPTTEAIRSDLQLIHQSANALLGIVDDILDFSKLEADSIRLHKTAVDVTDLLHDTVELLRPLATRKDIHYTFSQHGDGACVVLIDPVRVRQIITNLVGNALKFTEHGFVHVEQYWSARGAYLHLKVVVRDTGPGIAPDQTEAIFDDFYQADNSWTRSYGGTGLGLAISRRLAELMGGTISLESELGQGSCFTFDLCAESSEPATAADPAPGRQQFRGSVLLVDDNPVNLAVGEKLLSYMGLTVDTARDGYRAMDMAQAHSYDIIFMDIQMPDLDGLATCRQLRATGCDAPVIAVTADALPKDRQRCIEAGMQAVLTKPFRTKEITAVVRPYLKAASPPARG